MKSNDYDTNEDNKTNSENIELSRYNAFIDPNWYVYETGYKDAADSLIDSAIHLGPNFMVYPIMFLYRHYLEIQLKSILLTFQEYLGMPLKLPDPNLHALQYLWNEVLKLECIAIERDLWDSDDTLSSYKETAELINEFSKLDRGSYDFRYPVKKDLTPTLEKVTKGGGPAVINLLKLREVVDEATLALRGTGYKIAEYYDIRMDMEAEYQDNFL